MRHPTFSFWIFVVGAVVGIGQIALLGSQLPAQVASHFGVSGRPDAFMSRESFLTAQYALVGVTVALFATIPVLLKTLPSGAINLPNKDYWLAPERRAATLDYLADRLYAFGAATLALLTAVLQQVYAANAGGSPALGGANAVYLLLYLAYTGIWATTLVRRFARPADTGLH